MNEPDPHPEQTLLYEYLDGELPPAQLAALEEHLAQCPACSARLAQIQSLYAQIGAMPEHPPAHDFARPVLDAIRGLPAVRRKSWKILDLSTAVQALAVLALLWFALPSLYQPWIARGLAQFSTLAGWLSARLIAVLAALGQGRNAAQHGLDLLHSLQPQPDWLANLPLIQIITILSLATLVWLAGNGYLLGFWNRSSLRRKS